MTPSFFRVGLLALALALLLPLRPALAQAATLNHTRLAVKSIARAYGFVSGQSMALDLIEEAHPGLSAQVLSARESFDATLSDVKDKREAELSTAFGAAAFSNLRHDMLAKVIDELQQQAMPAGQARDFLAEV